MTGRCFTNGSKEAGIQNNHFGHLIGGASIDLIHFIGNNVLYFECSQQLLIDVHPFDAQISLGRWNSTDLKYYDEVTEVQDSKSQSLKQIRKISVKNMYASQIKQG